MIFVMGWMTVRPTDVERLEKPIARQIAETRTEAGCLHYALAHDVMAPSIIHVSERWRDQPSFGAHLVSDQMVRFNIDFRAAQMVHARVDSFHDDGSVRKLIDVNATQVRAPAANPARVIVMGTARMAPGEIERLSDAMRAQIEATRLEDGCEHYSFGRDGLDPDVLHIAERWRDRDALDAHFKMPHMAVFNAALGGADVRGISVKAYEDGGERVLMGAD